MRLPRQLESVISSSEKPKPVCPRVLHKPAGMGLKGAQQDLESKPPLRPALLNSAVYSRALQAVVATRRRSTFPARTPPEPCLRHSPLKPSKRVRRSQRGREAPSVRGEHGVVKLGKEFSLPRLTYMRLRLDLGTAACSVPVGTDGYRNRGNRHRYCTYRLY